MQTKRVAFLAILSILSIGRGQVEAADHMHQEVKARHGGAVVEVSDVEYELVRRDGALVIHVSDHGKAISTQGWSGSIAILGGEKGSAELAPGGENLLAVKGALKAPPGTRLLATINAPGKKPIQIRFTVK